MKFFIVLSCLLAAISAQDTTTGVLIAYNTGPTTAAATCLSTDFGIKCDTCTAGIVCAGSTTPAGPMTCGTTTPYCDTNTCVADKPDSCDVAFNCPSEGYFPDANSCEIYYFCTDTLAVEEYKCPTNYVFDIVNKNCKRKYYATDCVTMKCTKAGEWLVHAKDAAYYAYCDPTLTALVMKCPTSQTFDKVGVGCKFVCKSEGYFPGATAGEKYFCFKSGLTYKYEVLTCPAGYVFGTGTNCVKAAAK